MKINTLKNVFNRFSPKQIATIFFVISLLFTQFIVFKIYSIEKEHEYLLVRKEAVNVRNQLETSLNSGVTATRMIKFLAEVDLIEDNFNRLSKKLLDQNSFIDAIQLIEKNTIIKTYPLKGNEKVIGYEVLNDSTHRKEAMKALKRNKLYFEGPVNLHQGGVAIVGRLPIYKNNTYWGFSAVIIRINKLYKAMGVDSTGNNETYSYQLTKSRSNEAKKQIPFFNNPDDFSSGIYTTTFIPVGAWSLQVKLKNPTHYKVVLIFSICGIIISILISFIFWQLSAQPEKLKQLVIKKTRELEVTNLTLKRQSEQLMASNRELEQFAFITSHDLQEPLRMITSFMGLIKKKYSDQLDEKANQYIYYAIDGAKRMKKIILDLLDYSRAGRIEEETQTIDLNEFIENYKSLRRKVIEEKSAKLITDELPTIVANPSPMIQVFHALLDNAIKYSKANTAPIVEISVKEEMEEWIFSIKDNGIGIDNQFLDKIFIIFQRLHNRDQYEGTGIGLAIVKKHVESWGGRIWVTSELGKGSTFWFTLKK